MTGSHGAGSGGRAERRESRGHGRGRVREEPRGRGRARIPEQAGRGRAAEPGRRGTDQGRGRAADQGRGRGRKQGRRTGARSKRNRMILAATVSAAVLMTAAVGAIYLQLSGNINTFDGNGLSKNRPSDSAGQNILLIGSDSRAGNNSDFAGGVGQVGHSDTTILLHVYTDGKHAVGVSIPRDTLVDIPPCLLPDGKWSAEQPVAMFNSAFMVGGTEKGNPACTQNTVEKLTGLRVDHTMVVDFAGFAAMTDAIGGVQVCVPNNIYQGNLNPNMGHLGKLVFAKGMQTVSGTSALNYVRLRHGIGDGSDIGRMKRQQAFISSMIKKVQSEGFSPTTLLPLANAATKSLTVDPGLGSAEKLLSFAMSMKDINLKNIKFITAPWRYQGARVALVHPDSDALWAALKNDRTLDNQDASGGKKRPAAASSAAPTPTTAIDGAGISVAVYNGTTVTGLAAKAADTLRNDNFTVTGTAVASAQDHATTLIEYGAGHLQGAQELARAFPGAKLEQTAASGINLVLGQDYAAGSGSSSSAPAPTAVPTSVADQARSAADNPCSNLSYG